MIMSNTQRQYDVALSFAGEQRPYVERVADALRNAGVKVFYDNYEKTELWGKDLYSHLDYIYGKQATYCVIFASADYRIKVWTNHERSSAQARAIQDSDQEYILPVRFDETEIPGLRSTIGYLEASKFEPEELARLIKEKLGPAKVRPGLPEEMDRLIGALGIEGKNKKNRKKTARDIAVDFYQAMERMTADERRAVAGVLAFGCHGSLPEGVHISLDYLSRMTNMPPAQLLECLAKVRSLNVSVKTGPPQRDHLDKGALAADDTDVVLSFWTPRAKTENPSEVAYHTVQTAIADFCADHSLEALGELYFYRLSAAYDGPVLFECGAEETE